MAKEDFCFTYYDGDAARDTAHMTRIERGGYHDIISAQRKFGHLDMKILKRVLGSDFDMCWPNIEIIMKVDNVGKYYIEWVDNSIQKSQAHSKIQSEKVKQYWNDVKTGKKERKRKNDTTVIPQYEKSITPVIPLGNGDGYGNKNFKEEGMGEENFSNVVPCMQTDFKKIFPGYPVDQETDFPALTQIVAKIMKLDKLTGWPSSHAEHILRRWGEIIDHIHSDSHLSRYSLVQINKHFQSVIQSFNRNASTNGTNRQTGTYRPVITGSASTAGSF